MRFVLLLVILLSTSVLRADIVGTCYKYLSLLSGSNLNQHGFELKKVMADFSSQDFVDNQGQPFRFARARLDQSGRFAHLDLSVEHAQLGFISQVTDSITVDWRGHISGNGTMVDYDKFRNRGFLSRMFEFFRERLPEGSELTLEDASDSAPLRRRLQRVSNQELLRFLETPLGKKLWKGFQAVSEIESDHSIASLFRREKFNTEGFKRYIFDIYSVWGRVVRKGNYRGDYLARWPLGEGILAFTKYEISVEVLELERDIMRSTKKPIDEYFGL